MQLWIQHVPEPRRLILTWQPSDLLADRFRWAVGILWSREGGANCNLRYFRPGEEFASHNDGRDPVGLQELGYRGLPAFGLGREIHEVGVMQTMLRRLPPRARPDFAAYLQAFRLPQGVPISDFALLGMTEARTPNDGFSLIDPLEAAEEWQERLLEVVGSRHYRLEGEPLPAVGRLLDLLREPTNLHDPNAVQVFDEGRLLGYINRLQAPTVGAWLQQRDIRCVADHQGGRLKAFLSVRPARVQSAAE